MAHLDTIIELINNGNALGLQLYLTESGVIISDPVSQASPGGTKNTMITVQAVPGSGFAGTANMFYNRIDFSEFGADFGLAAEDPFTPESFLAALNQSRNQYQSASVVSEDVPTLAIPVMETLVKSTITLTADPASLMWKGSVDVPVVIGIPASAAALNEYVQQTMAQLLN